MGKRRLKAIYSKTEPPCVGICSKTGHLDVNDFYGPRFYWRALSGKSDGPPQPKIYYGAVRQDHLECLLYLTNSCTNSRVLRVPEKSATRLHLPEEEMVNEYKAIKKWRRSRIRAGDRTESGSSGGCPYIAGRSTWQSHTSQPAISATAAKAEEYEELTHHGLKWGDLLPGDVQQGRRNIYHPRA